MSERVRRGVQGSPGLFEAPQTEQRERSGRRPRRFLCGDASIVDREERLLECALIEKLKRLRDRAGGSEHWVCLQLHLGGVRNQRLRCLGITSQEGRLGRQAYESRVGVIPPGLLDECAHLGVVDLRCEPPAGGALQHLQRRSGGIVLGVGVEARPWLRTRALRTDSRIPPLPGEQVIVKKRASGFHGTFLSSFLNAHGVQQPATSLWCFTMCGCVRHSCEDAIRRASGPSSCARRSATGAGVTEWNLFDVDAKFGDVEPLERVLAYLSGIEAFTSRA